MKAKCKLIVKVICLLILLSADFEHLPKFTQSEL